MKVMFYKHEKTIIVDNRQGMTNAEFRTRYIIKNPEKDLDYYIKKLEGVPEENWITGQLWTPEGKGCVQGWLGARGLDEDSMTITYEMPEELLSFLALVEGKNIPGINNGYKNCGYTQPTPKQRILAYLRDLQGK